MTKTLRPMIPEEYEYTYSKGGDERIPPLQIGHIRADFGSNGTEFWHTWWPGAKEHLNDPEFKKDLCALIDELREEGKLLENRQALAKFCAATPAADMGDDRQYGIRADTQKYTYFLRLSPHMGDYNLYCYCYLKTDIGRT